MTAAGAELLVAHLATWLGRWPPAPGHVEVVASAARVAPAWDGTVHPLLGVVTTDAGVVSVPPAARRAVARRTRELGDLATIGWQHGAARDVGRPDHVVGVGVFRALTEASTIADLPEAGRWVAASDGQVPAWLRPFNAPQVLLVEQAGRVVAGVGCKLHDRFGAEIAVVTDPAARGRGLGRRLVAQAARRILAGGRVATYLHDPDNEASARVAEAVGFADRGWRVLGLFPADGG